MKKSSHSTASKVWLAIIVAAIWGGFPALGKLGMLEVPTFTFLTIRYVLTFLVFIPFVKVRKGDWKIIILFALCDNVINNGINFWAFQQLTPTASILLLQTGAPVAVLMACLFAGEKVNMRQTFGIVTSMVGVMVILRMPHMSLIGVAGIMLTRVLWGFCEILFKGSAQLQPSAFLAYSSLIAIPFMLGMSLSFESDFYEQISALNWSVFGITMFFQVFGLSTAMIIWQKLIAQYGVSNISPFSFLQIIFGIFSGVWLFGDPITVTTILGTILIASGVLLTAEAPQKMAPGDVV